jgi:hypothetical protein
MSAHFPHMMHSPLLASFTGFTSIGHALPHFPHDTHFPLTTATRLSEILISMS